MSDEIEALYVSPPNFAILTGMPESWVYTKCREGRLPSTKNGKYVRIPTKKALELFETGKV